VLMDFHCFDHRTWNLYLYLHKVQGLHTFDL
jgi:hypothetical protein